LLDFGDSRKSDALIRLIETADEEIAPNGYCTLSHCWGQARLTQLNELTSTSLRSGICIDHFPRAFRDAIIITKRLGTRYLWIDSLCIKQDSRSEWLRESALMHKVYSHSYCNISASASFDSSGGLFRTRNPRLLETTEVDLNVSGLDSGPQYVRCIVLDEFFWNNNLLNCVINSRGWVMQERLLTPRVLHFGEHQLFWECYEKDSCESSTHGLASVYATQLAFRFKELDLFPYMKNMANVATYTIWDKIIQMYSQTMLTIPGDKLVALFGVAKRMADAINDEYVAGIWRKRLVVTLPWCCPFQRQVDGSPSVRPKSYRAPTWSWASLDGMVEMLVVETLGDDDRNITIQVEDVQLQYATEDTTGIVTGGWLDLKGPLRPMQLSKLGDTTFKTWHMVPNGVRVRPQDPSKLGPNVYFDEAPFGDGAFDIDNVEQRLFYMTCRLPSKDSKYMHMLLLRLADGDTKLFERFGVAIASDGDDQEMLQADLKEKVKSLLPCLRYENGLHTIRII
ncbi:HET-domain-containing protein, partial [Setomelanomma holmii]